MVLRQDQTLLQMLIGGTQIAVSTRQHAQQIVRLRQHAWISGPCGQSKRLLGQSLRSISLAALMRYQTPIDE